MKKKIISIILAAALMLTVCGCENGGGSAETTTTTSATEVVTTTAAETTTITTTTAETTTETTTTTAAETTTSAETTEPEVTTDDDDDVAGTGLIDNAKTGDGFITYEKALISEDLAAVGMSEKPLTEEAVLADYELYGTNSKNLYYFAMINEDGVQELPSSDSTVFISVLVLDGVTYGVTYGTGEKVSLEDVLPYASPNTYVEYWAFANVSGNGQITLIPFIAGSENSGYYLVTPVLNMLGADVEGMTPPAPVGDPYTPGTATDESENKIILNITSVENNDLITTVNCTLENTYDIPICLIGETLTVNGTDCSDLFTAFFVIPAGETITDCFYISETQLSEGDELQIVFSGSNDETYEGLGKLTYNLVLSKN